jgi:DNA-binding GntR family transcriptional regulator
MGVSTRYVREILQQIEDRGFIEREQEHKWDNREILLDHRRLGLDDPLQNYEEHRRG